MKAPGLPDESDHRRKAGCEQDERLVLGGLGVTAAGHPEGAHRSLPELDVGEHLEELELLRVGARETGLDEVDAELVELPDHPHLLLRGQGHALALHAVAQSRVVEQYLSHRFFLSFEGER